MKINCLIILTFGLILSADPVGAGDPADVGDEERLQADYEAMIEETQRLREAASEVAELAREAARLSAEANKIESELWRDRTEEQALKKRLETEEAARARQELSRAHRDLREASREVARAHRELARAASEQHRIRMVNLGDRAVMGVILGETVAEGVRIIGVSPDGPAERAGLQPGDILVSIRGTGLGSVENSSPRETIGQVMDDVGEGEELAVSVLRQGQLREYVVIAELREPSGWQSLIRIPEAVGLASAPGDSELIIEHIEVPEIDHEALEEQVKAITEQAEAIKLMFVNREAKFAHDYPFEIEDMSEMGQRAMREADVRFDFSHTRGLELAAVNQELGTYFKTDRGVLVIRANKDNDYQLQSGDVVLQLGELRVDTPSDMIRALRDIEPGSELEISIKRGKRDKKLSVVIPENRFGHRSFLHPAHKAGD